MSIRVGEVIAVHGIKVTLRIDEDSSKETLYFKGDKYKGVSIREYIAIQRGFRSIVCLVEGEYLDENRVEGDGVRASYIRKVEARPVGYFEGNEFRHGIKFMPMIKVGIFSFVGLIVVVYVWRNKRLAKRLLMDEEGESPSDK